MITKEMTRGETKFIGVEDGKSKFSIPVTLTLKDGEDVIYTATDEILYKEGLIDELHLVKARLQRGVEHFEAARALDDNQVVDDVLADIKKSITTNL